MPNHFHLVVWPRIDGELSEFMQWFTATHSKRWHVHRQSTGTGSVYQGRFKALPVQSDTHFLTLCRYVERNPLRARLVDEAQDWPWSSLAQRCKKCNVPQLADWPILQPTDWLMRVNAADKAERDLAELRRCVRRGRPFGEDQWSEQIAKALGLVSSLRSAGRPRKAETTSGVVLRKP